MLSLRRAAGAVAAVALGAPCGASAASLQPFGDPLTDTSNATFGCEAQPQIADTSGNYALFASGQADCTWANTGGGTVPGDGVVQTVTIKSGPAPAPLRFVVVRTLSQPGTGTACCIFAGESTVFQPTPNAVETFPVSLPVERNTNPANQIITQDNIGVSAVAGAGTLPLHDNGRHNIFDAVDPSNNASWYYPRLGAASGDSGGGRHPNGGSNGWKVLIQVGWCAAGQTCGADGGTGGGGTGGGGTGGGGSAGTGGTTAPPSVTQPAFSNRVFRVAPDATPLIARVATGTKLTFALSAPADASIAIQRPAAGKRKGKSCVKPSKRLRRARKCTRWKTVGTLIRKGLPAGAVTIPFTGRLGTKALLPGPYRAAITARGSDGRRSRQATARFRIVH